MCAPKSRNMATLEVSKMEWQPSNRTGDTVSSTSRAQCESLHTSTTPLHSNTVWHWSTLGKPADTSTLKAVLFGRRIVGTSRCEIRCGNLFQLSYRIPRLKPYRFHTTGGASRTQLSLLQTVIWIR